MDDTSNFNSETTGVANILDGIRIAKFGYSVSQKIELITDLHSKLGGKSSNYRVRESIDNQYNKLISDMKEMIIKFNSLKWQQTSR